MATYRSEYIEALSLLACAAEELAARGLPKPILVGGGAVEYYTVSDIQSGDLDLVSPRQEELEQALIRQGFERSRRPGEPIRGLIHRRLAIGVEVVGSSLMDGRADRDHIRLVPIGDFELPVIGIEDLIADRIGQYYSAPGGVHAMLQQAKELLAIADALQSSYDPVYLARRLHEETAGECDLDEMKRLIDANTSQ